MATTTSPTGAATVEPGVAVRVLAAALAAIVLVDAVSVGAPGLALLGVPFALTAWRFDGRSRWLAGLTVAWAALYVALGANYALANGLDAPLGDLLFAYVGTPVAVALGWFGLRVVLGRA